ncbi:unnamed protein product [Candidula unifasciata]|uniref:Alpha-and gamma-adaptin-binding protein p34 n=1 Tax=Candidula unifasciata TaxID=100452 RepID=A0A8S3YU14_9EUPU|nr:unnamed protein product [Candidula unifasciata]
MALPSVLFSSSADSFKPHEFVRHILKVPELPQPQIVSDHIERYEWSFETKYYSARAHLCTTDVRTIGDQEFAESVQAFIHFFDPNVPPSFELAKAWLPYLDHINPDILMLVCNTSRNSDAIQRKVALEWCIQNSFELVELYPEQESDDEEDDFPETTGMARIIQALHAHTWPNLDMKDAVTVQSPYLRHMMQEQHILNKELHSIGSPVPVQHSSELSQLLANSNTLERTSNDDANAQNVNAVDRTDEPEPTSQTIDTASNNIGQSGTGKETAPNVTTSDLEDVLLPDDIDWKTLLVDGGEADESTSGSHVDVDDFEQLFMKLKVMKDRAENLPPEERKKYAEKVAVCFWKAIGGDEDEITGLDDSE